MASTILSDVVFAAMVCVLTRNAMVDMRKIILYQELNLDLWSCDDIFGPMSLQWFSRDAVRCGLVGNLVIYDAVILTASIARLPWLR